MLASIRSEIRKLLSVRSTYVVTILGLLVVGALFGFYGSGWEAAEGVKSPDYMTSVALNGATFMAIFVSVVALLSVTHEFRYNTITYTLTSSNSRTKSLLAKMIVIGAFALLFMALATAITPLMARLGMELKGLELVPQTFDFVDVAWRALFFGFANAMAAAMLGFIVRNQVGTIMTYFIVINTIEGLLGLLLKHNTRYLPFSALGHVINMGGGGEEIGQLGSWSPSEGALVFGIYLIVGWLIAWVLFLRRDAIS